MILSLGCLGVGRHLADLDERPEREWPIFVGKKIPSEWMKAVGRRTNMMARVGIYPRDANTWRVHPGEVAENDPHRIESQVHRAHV